MFVWLHKKIWAQACPWPFLVCNLGLSLPFSIITVKGLQKLRSLNHSINAYFILIKCQALAKRRWWWEMLTLTSWNLQSRREECHTKKSNSAAEIT